ncbi:MAG: hypothetical protein JWO37_2296 [Acidimicrobiales bacterium]|jgi:hypothetical protein|nr:hypothetical protein [Acidimicrobiales bacterium]
MDDRDELRHPPGAEPFWSESWYFDFATPDGRLGGYLRLGIIPSFGRAWWWACLVGQDRPLVVVRDHDVAIPAAGLEIRGEGLWADLICETPWDHWSVGLEAFAVALDDPADAYRGEWGDRVALGFDLEWEARAAPYAYPAGITRYEVPCRVHGEVLVGSERLAIDAIGERDHSWGGRDWWGTPGWCWTAGQMADGSAFHAVAPTGSTLSPGFVLDPGADQVREIDLDGGFRVDTVLGAEDLPVTATMSLAGVTMDVAPVAHAPVLLEAPDGRISRFPRSLCRFTSTDSTGVGWTEWLQPGVR